MSDGPGVNAATCRLIHIRDQIDAVLRDEPWLLTSDIHQRLGPVVGAEPVRVYRALVNMWHEGELQRELRTSASGVQEFAWARADPA